MSIRSWSCPIGCPKNTLTNIELNNPYKDYAEFVMKEKLDKDNIISELRYMLKIEIEGHNHSQEMIRKLKQAVLDANFVLEGSKALSGQSDETLEKRENALMRFLQIVGEIE